jgi:hypothetical protein
MEGSHRVRVLRLLVGSVSVALVSATAAVAFHTSTHRTAAGKGVTAVKIASDSAPQQVFDETPWQNVEGARRTIVIPEGDRALILATFTAESECIFVGESDVCLVRILIGGQPGHPDDSASTGEKGYIFDSSEAEPSDAILTPQGHSIAAFRGPLSHGTYVVQVQARLSDQPSGYLVLDDWILVVERIAV